MTSESRITEDVDFDAGYSLPYTLVVWQAKDDPAKEAFEAIRGLEGSHRIFFANDYDKEHNFHVNTWPEVEQEMLKLDSPDVEIMLDDTGKGVNGMTTPEKTHEPGSLARVLIAEEYGVSPDEVTLEFLNQKRDELYADPNHRFVYRNPLGEYEETTLGEVEAEREASLNFLSQFKKNKHD